MKTFTGYYWGTTVFLSRSIHKYGNWKNYISSWNFPISNSPLSVVNIKQVIFHLNTHAISQAPDLLLTLFIIITFYFPVFQFLRRCWCVFTFSLTKSTGVLTPTAALPASLQTVPIRTLPGAVELSLRWSAPCFPTDHVWPSWGDWQDLFTGGETRRKERRKEGEPEGEQSLNGTGIQVFTLDPSF